MNKSKKIALLGLLIALATVLGYVDALIPMPLPGIKLGLSNVAVLFAIYTLGNISGVCISLLRVILISFIFGTGMLMYSFAGACAALAGMMIAKAFMKEEGIIAVSIIGAVLHVFAQVCVAAAVTSQPILFLTYFPLIAVASIICGMLTGVAAKITMKSGIKEKQC